MSGLARYASLTLSLLVFAGCAQRPQASVETGSAAPVAAASPGGAHASALPQPEGHAFGQFPDRGELLAYPGRIVRQEGAYTWHRTDLSEAHALHAIADGHLRVTTPSGELLDFQYDQHIEHSSGDWTWVGHIAGHAAEQTILTFGADAAFGSIAQPGKLPLRLTVRDGTSWLVETDPRKVAGIVNAATRPRKPDYFVAPKPPFASRVSRAAGDSASVVPSNDTAVAATATSTTVDVVLGYTAGFVVENGGTASSAGTRLNFLVDVANIAYQNSQIGARVRLVATVLVNYTDTTTNDSTLEQLTGYNQTTNTQTTPNTAFNALRTAREQYGADLVSLVRGFKDPEQDGCGTGWLIGGGQSGISRSDEYFGYSVVSDGDDVGIDGRTYYCRDETLAHELGHNMGANHDREAAKGTDGILNASDYGVFPYSFGYKTTATTGNFYTVMAYGDSGQTLYRIFSDPRSTFCGLRACGIADQADNARTLIQTMPIIATFRATVVAVVARAVKGDFNGDGVSDIVWRNSSTGSNSIWKSANASTAQSMAAVPDLNWKIVGTGDFDADGKADVLWRNSSTGSNSIWKSANAATALSMASVADLNWKIVGTGDFDGDGKADVVWRNSSTGANAIWKSANAATQQAMASVADLHWNIVGTGDFDGDGKSDVVWRNSSTGANVIWRSANAATQQAMTTVPDLNWNIVGTGDFDGDGKSDVVWRNSSTGSNSIWKSANVATALSMAGVADLNWKIVGTGDFDGDGKSDVQWRNTSTGANAIWRSANAATRQAMATVPDLNWKVVP